jgi:hypothetical protein
MRGAKWPSTKELIDKLLADYKGPEEVERAMHAERTHHFRV